MHRGLLILLAFLTVGTRLSAGFRDTRQASSGVCRTGSEDTGLCLTPHGCRRLLKSRRIDVPPNNLGRGTCPRRRICCPDGEQRFGNTQDCGEQRNAFTPSILGGRAAREGEWPWMVSLSIGNGHECGGVLVTGSHVVTAAHCVTDDKGKQLPASRFSCRVGLLDLRGREGQKRTVNRLAVHPSFNLTVFRADVAVLRLDQPVLSTRSSMVGPVCLPVRERVLPYEGKFASVAGWGDTREGGNGSHTLQTVGSLPIWNRSRCSTAYRGVLDIGEGLYCAGFESGRRDSCQGDSGDPLMWFDPSTQKFSLVGIVSTGLGCGRRGFPGLYTDVLHYLPWIRQQID